MAERSKLEDGGGEEKGGCTLSTTKSSSPFTSTSRRATRLIFPAKDGFIVPNPTSFEL
jgi:hypothetical protein